MKSRLAPYKDLLLVFIWREFIIRYKQTVIGVLLAILQPLSLMALFTFIFGVVLKFSHKEYPYVLFFYAGGLPWTFFSGAANFSVTCLSGNFNLLTKIYFPREIIPLSGVAIHFIDYLLGLAVYFFLLVMYRVPLTWNFLWMIPLLILLVTFTTAVSLLLADLNVYYRDVKMASTFLLQFLFFSTPIIYSVDAVDSRWKFLLFLNPLSFIVENMRRVTIEGRGITLWQMVIVVIGVAVLYLAIYRIFSRIKRAFVDVLYPHDRAAERLETIFQTAGAEQLLSGGPSRRISRPEKTGKPDAW